MNGLLANVRVAGMFRGADLVIESTNGTFTSVERYDGMPAGAYLVNLSPGIDRDQSVPLGFGISLDDTPGINVHGIVVSDTELVLYATRIDTGELYDAGRVGFVIVGIGSAAAIGG